MNKTYTVTADLDYVDGHLRYGYRQLTLTQEQVEVFRGLTKEEQEDWFQDGGETIVTDYEINGYGGLDIDSIIIEEE